MHGRDADWQLFGVVMNACVYVYTCMSCAATPPFFAFSVQVEFSLWTASLEPFSVALMPEGALSILDDSCVLINIDHACMRSVVPSIQASIDRVHMHVHRLSPDAPAFIVTLRDLCCIYLFVLSSLNIKHVEV